MQVKNQIEKKSLKNQNGLSMIEILIVVVILGILYAMIAPSLGGGTDKANAVSVARISQKLQTNWTLLSQICGTSSNPASSPITANSATNTLKLLIGGNNSATSGYSVPAAYTACYKQSKIMPLSDSAQWDAVASQWKIANLAMELARTETGAQAFFDVKFLNVPEDLALMIVQQFVPSESTLKATAETTYIPVHYTAATSGTRTVTVRRPIY